MLCQMKISIFLFSIFLTNLSYASDVCCDVEGSSPYCVLIKKSAYTLSICDKNGLLDQIPAVFGKSGLGDKMIEGDDKTPEGKFKIVEKKDHKDWVKFLRIDYPNQASQARFEKLKSEGKIPANAKIGAGIGIHGTVKNGDIGIDNHENNTDGCIGIKNEDVIYLDKKLPIGTPVEIRP